MRKSGDCAKKCAGCTMDCVGARQILAFMEACCKKLDECNERGERIEAMQKAQEGRLRRIEVLLQEGVPQALSPAEMGFSREQAAIDFIQKWHRLYRSLPKKNRVAAEVGVSPRMLRGSNWTEFQKEYRRLERAETGVPPVHGSKIRGHLEAWCD